jgi:hypothetical protein
MPHDSGPVDYNSVSFVLALGFSTEDGFSHFHSHDHLPVGSESVFPMCQRYLTDSQASSNPQCNE